MKHMLKGIIFDYDGTLSKRYVSAYHMYRWIIHEVLPDLDEDSFDFEMIVQRCMIRDEFGNIGKRHTLSFLKDEYVPDLDVEYWQNVWSRKFAEFQTLMDGCIELLEDLSKKYTLGIMTNGDGDSQNAKVSASGIRKYFHTVIACGDYGIQKPDPEIYRIAAEKMGLKCEEIAFVGDTFATDIAGAIRSGMYPVWLCHEHKGISKYPVKQISDLKEVRELFL